MLTRPRSSRTKLIVLAISAILLQFLAYLIIPKPAPEPSAIVGTWVHADSASEQTRVNFNADGSFSIEGVPPQVFASYGSQSWNEPLDWNTTIDLSGTWTITGQREAGNPTITVVLTPTESRASTAN